MHNDAIEHYARANNPTAAFDQAGAEVITRARSIFAEELAKLSDEQARAALAFYTSPTGRKELKAADAVAVNLHSATKGGANFLARMDAHMPKVQELIDALGFEAILNGFRGSDKIPVETIAKVFTATYGSLLNQSELDEIIRFHKSDAGKKYTD